MLVIELQPEPSVSSNPSPFSLDERPKTNAIATRTAMIINIPILIQDFYK